MLFSFEDKEKINSQHEAAFQSKFKLYLVEKISVDLRKMKNVKLSTPEISAIQELLLSLEIPSEIYYDEWYGECIN